VAQNYPTADWRANGSRVQIAPYADALVEKSTRRALYSLLSAALLLWLIACVNATNLLLARAIARQREMAMRGALGASRWRLTQQLIVESCILNGIAALLGSAIAVGIIIGFRHTFKSVIPLDVSATLNLTILGSLVALTLISAAVAAAWPAWLAAH